MKRVPIIRVPKPGDIIFSAMRNLVVKVISVEDYSYEIFNRPELAINNHTMHNKIICFEYPALAGPDFKTIRFYQNGDCWKSDETFDKWAGKNIWFKATKKEIVNFKLQLGK